MKRSAHRRPEVPGGAGIFRRIFTRLGCSGRPPQFMVEFRPYTGLTHTIRLREETAYVRLSDMMRGAPMGVLESAAALLLARIYRKRVPHEMRETYRRFYSSAATRRRILAARRTRGRRIARPPGGNHHDLGALFDKLNGDYFGGGLLRPRLGWSRRPWRSLLGCCDAALGQVVLNCALDRKDVPNYAVAYVLYHEMLHWKHPARFARCRLQSHSSQFRAQERLFEDYARARLFLLHFSPLA